MKKVNVLFLDIDGVLNSTKWMSLLHHEDTFRKKSSHSQPFDPVCVRIINQVCSEFDVEVVVSSTWRGMPMIDRVLNIAGLECSFFNSSYIDLKNKLPSEHYIAGESDKDRAERVGTITTTKLTGLGGFRGDQIDDWFKRFGSYVDKWAIIDDDSDFHPHQKERFVHTDGENGISFENYRELRKIFGGND